LINFSCWHRLSKNINTSEK